MIVFSAKVLTNFYIHNCKVSTYTCSWVEVLQNSPPYTKRSWRGCVHHYFVLTIITLRYAWFCGTITKSKLFTPCFLLIMSETASGVLQISFVIPPSLRLEQACGLRRGILTLRRSQSAWLFRQDKKKTGRKEFRQHGVFIANILGDCPTGPYACRVMMVNTE